MPRSCIRIRTDFGPVGVVVKSLFVAGAPGNLHCADKLGSPGFEELKNFALVSIHDTNLANNGTRVERFHIAVDRQKIERLHIVGGGSQAMMLNQFAANVLKIPVLAGPTECAATGNILIQAIALGHLPSHAAAREVVRNSFVLKTITPQDAAQWDAAAARFDKLLS